MQHKYLVTIDSPSFIDKQTVATLLLDAIANDPYLHLSQLDFDGNLDKISAQDTPDLFGGAA